ncbi:polyunsaturated fatty acid 5-lipoxygenase-like [Physella acuta]|uniref:polyunsaturated fatty acid 5-lipoxygenase-like n=1 Tax=Physella acuta TaxID=109671 RepID=UPI0027DD4670|nr:polyunsaturated fatty acid 5-lipoxygenase-like [Physella acuta]
MYLFQKPDFVVVIYTGNRDLAGTNAHIYIKLYDEHNNSTPAIHLDNPIVNDFERGSIDSFKLGSNDTSALVKSSKVLKIELWRDNHGIGAEWFVEKVEVQNKQTNETFVFPVFRWVRADVHYTIQHLDTDLPQCVPADIEAQRKSELAYMKSRYELDHKFPSQYPGGPCQIKKVPLEEMFSGKDILTIGGMAVKLKATAAYTAALKCKVNSLSDLGKIYSKEFNRPERAAYWMSDEYFALQRLAGLNHSIIELVTHIPEKFPVTDDLLRPFLEGLNISQAIAQKRLYICDLHLLDGLTCKENRKLCSPIALFFVGASRKLKPVAIQLFQKPGETNPIFTPACHHMTWTLVKMWYNHADAAYHQGLTHLGFTHLLMEGFSLATHRHLSISHPMYKILAPHFLNLHAINSLALSELLADGGWVDKTMNYGNKGMYELMLRGYKVWSLDHHGILHNDLKRRGVVDPEALPDYHYRDDAILLYDAISDYVKGYIDLYYTSQQSLMDDYEIQNWVEELAKERSGSHGGIGILGLPGNGSLTSLDQLKDIVTCVIYISSVGHAATNFLQYDEYGFPPNFPLTLIGNPPNDPTYNASESDVVKALPDMVTIMDSLIITKILSTKSTKSLGDFEVQYIYDPRAIPLVNNFRKRMLEITQMIDTRNKDRRPSYNYLDPKYIPNSISI